MNRVLRRCLALPGKLPGYTRTLRRFRSRSLAIVMYHGVDREPMKAPHWCHLDAARFEAHLEFLCREYTITSIREAVEGLSGRAPLPERCVVLTFDDGLRDVYTTVFPMLRRLGAPATVFVVTGLVDSRQPTWLDRLYLALVETPRTSVRWDGEAWPLTTSRERGLAYSALGQRFKSMPNADREARVERFIDELGRPPEVPIDSPLATMGWDEIEELSRSGLITFGSHTVTHPILSRCDSETQRRELQASRDVLRERLGGADYFAYPNGGRADFTGETKRLLAELGYRCGLATVPGLNQVGCDLFELRRVAVGSETTLRDFELLMAEV